MVLKQIQKKIEAIEHAPQPKNVTELQSFLGLVNYYGKFIPNISSVLYPLYQLQQAFKSIKKLIINDNVLTFFDPTKPIIISCDASSYELELY